MATHRTKAAVCRRLLLSITAGVAFSATAGPRLTGLPVQPEQRLTKALEKTNTEHCDGPATVTQMHDGSLRGQAFKLFTVACQFGNTSGESQIVAFHDGKRYTRVLSFSALNVTAPVSVDADRIVYEAVAEKPGDARCCPSGRVRIEIDTEQLSASLKAVGFKRQFPPSRGTVLK